VVDSISTSARVSSKRFIRNQAFLDERTKGRNREDTNRGCRLSIALHPVHIRPQSGRRTTDDSEQALDLFPNHRSFSYRGDFGGR